MQMFVSQGLSYSHSILDQRREWVVIERSGSQFWFDAGDKSLVFCSLIAGSDAMWSKSSDPLTDRGTLPFFPVERCEVDVAIENQDLGNERDNMERDQKMLL